MAFPNETTQGPKIIAAFASQLNHTQSEDCLAVNVWTKSTSCEAKKPILIFFYGGRWSIGDTSTPFYDGSNFADAEDVVIVTLGYRINIFGFPGTPDGPKNLAFLDQRLAVEWIRDNAAAFGGDPNKIIILGQSSGSVAVDYWSFAYVDDPIVAGYVSHSGNAFSFPTNNESLAAAHWYNASAILGCGSSGDVLPCMRNQTWQAIEAAGQLVKPPPTTDQARSQPAFQPTIDNVTVFTVDEYASRLSNGNFSKLPYLFGNNNNEAGYYKIAPYAQGTILTDAGWANFNAEDFTCPNTFSAYQRRKHHVPVWLFRYFADWDNLRLYGSGTNTSGAYHGSDVDLLLGNSEAVSGLPETTTQMQAQTLMQSAWAAFANDTTKGLSKFGWPLFDRERESLIEIAYNNSAVARFAAPQDFDSVCPGLNLTFYNLPS